MRRPALAILFAALPLIALAQATDTPPAVPAPEPAPPAVAPARSDAPATGVSPSSTPAPDRPPPNLAAPDLPAPGTPTQPLPAPPLGENASARDFLHAAESALVTGRNGEAQQALEMAQTRLLDRSVPLFKTRTPSANPAVAQIAEALQALKSGDRMRTLSLIQAVIPNAAATPE